MGLSVDTFKILSDPAADPCRGQTVVRGSQAVDTTVKGK
jgi:hypothetical protein